MRQAQIFALQKLLTKQWKNILQMSVLVQRRTRVAIGDLLLFKLRTQHTVARDTPHAYADD